MATPYSLGYLSISTTKYGFVGYGDDWLYGVNYAPPQPDNLAIDGYPHDSKPTISDPTPQFVWELAYGTTDDLVYQIQINFGEDDFSSPDVGTASFSAPTLSYELAEEYELTEEGTYYARIRSSDGYTWSDWSESTAFILYTFGAYPPTIDTVTSPADDFWQIITGTKQSGLYVYIRNNEGDWSEVSYPNGVAGSTWSVNMPLVTGTNTIEAISSVTQNTESGTSSPVSATIFLILKQPEVFNVWNAFDELGLILGLERIPGETNKKYKNRLLEVYKHPANSTEDGLLFGVAREMGVTTDHIRIERLSDLAEEIYKDNILTPDGNALGTKLEDYANEIYDNNPIFWGNIISDESYWDGVDEESSGYTFLPHQWDPTASGIYSKWLAPGIGDNDDLYVKKVDEIWNPGISGYSWYLFIHSGFFYSAYPSGVLGV